MDYMIPLGMLALFAGSVLPTFRFLDWWFADDQKHPSPRRDALAAGDLQGLIGWPKRRRPATEERLRELFPDSYPRELPLLHGEQAGSQDRLPSDALALGQ